MRKEGWFLISFLLMLVSFFYDKQILDFIRAGLNLNILLFMGWISHLVFFVVVILICSYLLKDKIKIIYLWGGLGLSYILSLVLKYLIQMPRPMWAYSQGYGFPSGHAAVYFFAYIYMKENYGKYNNIFLGIALLVCFSRLYLGEHYLSQVIGGGLLGTITYFGIKKWLKS